MNSRASYCTNHFLNLVRHAESIGWMEVGRRIHNGQVMVTRHWINERYNFMSLQKSQSCTRTVRTRRSLVTCEQARARPMWKTWLQPLWWDRRQAGEQAWCLIILYAPSAFSISQQAPGRVRTSFLCLWKHQNTFDASSSLFLLVDVGLQHLRWCKTNKIQNYARVLSATALLWSCNGLCNYFLGVVFKLSHCTTCCVYLN